LHEELSKHAAQAADLPLASSRSQRVSFRSSFVLPTPSGFYDERGWRSVFVLKKCRTSGSTFTQKAASIATNVAGVAGSALLAEGMRQLLSRE